MTSAVRIRIVPMLVALGLAAAGLGVWNHASAATPRILMVDNDAPPPSQGPNFWNGQWGFSPGHVSVLRGEPVVFDNPAGNFRAHNVVSIWRAGSPTEPVLESGSKFSSGTAREAALQPGNSWTLDTSVLEPGHYTYYCTIHPWMVGSISVLAP